MDKTAYHLGQETDGEIKYVGLCEIGVKKDSFYALREATRDIIIKQDKSNVWLEPLIQCKVKHISRDSGRNFREATFQEFIL